MNKEWVENKTAKHMKKIEQLKTHIVAEINKCELIPEREKPMLLKIVDGYEKESYVTANTMILALQKVMRDIDVEIDWFDNFVYKTLKLEDYIMAHRYKWFGDLLDSDPVEFDGDIIITDPCYILKHRDRSTEPKWEDYMRLPTYQGMTRKQMEEAGYFEDYAKLQEAQRKWDEENPDDWDVCECGYNMGALGLKRYMTRSTIYGDWSCTTFDSDTKESIGHFCADAGQVGVFDLGEILDYNSEYNDHVEKPWCVTLIRSFKGTVQFIVEDDKSGHEDYSVRVVGRGMNKVTGEPMNFITSQTGL